MKHLSLTIFMIFIGVVLMGAGTSDNSYKIRGKDAAKDIELFLGTGGNLFRVPAGGGDTEFSNDNGVSFKKVGAGGGSGGVNILNDNSDCESGDPPANWTASAGTFIAAVGAGFDNQACSWDASATSQTLDHASTFTTIPDGLEGRHCDASIEYKYDTGSSGDYKIQVIANTAGLLAEDDLPVSSVWRTFPIGFDCPSSDSVKVRIISTADGNVILIDTVQLGRNIFKEVTQASFFSKFTWVAATNCIWDRTGTTTTWGSFALDSDCSDPIIEGQGVIPSTKIPKMDLGLVPVGRYVIFSSGGSVVDSGTTSGAMGCAIIDEGGNEVAALNWNSNSTNTANQANATMTGEFSVPVSASKTLELQCYDNTVDTISLQNFFTSTGPSDFKITVYRYPLSSAEAITLETSGGEFTASHGTDCSFSDTNASLSEFAVDSSCTFNSVSSGIFNSVVSDNTAGDEKPGLILTANRIGTAEVCYKTQMSIASGPASSHITAEVFYNIGAGDVVVGLGSHRLNTSGDNMVWPYSGCVNVPVQPSQTTRVFYKSAHTSTGTVSLGFQSLDSAAILWSGHLISEGGSSLLFTELQNILKTSNNGTRFESVHVAPNCTSTPCTMINNTAGITGITRSAAGTYTVNYTAFATAPSCVVGSIFTGGVKHSYGSSVTTTSINVLTQDTTDTDADSGFSVHCSGI